MAVYGWIYANAQIKGDMGDYHIRRCDTQIAKYQSILTTVSRSMLAVTKRYGEAEMQQCWFAGFLDGGKRMYALALAGKQDTLLGEAMAGGGFRKQYSVFAYVFTGEDIRLYERRQAIFAPLFENLREIQRFGRREWGKDTQIICDFSAYAAAGAAEGPARQRQDGSVRTAPALQPGREKEKEKEKTQRDIGQTRGRIAESTAAADWEIWEGSLQRPAATGLLGVEEARKILAVFPDAAITMAGAAGEIGRADAGKSKGLKERFEKEDEEKRRRKQEQERLMQKAEESRKLLEAETSRTGRGAAKTGGGIWRMLSALCLLFCVMCLLRVISGTASGGANNGAAIAAAALFGVAGLFAARNAYGGKG